MTNTFESTVYEFAEFRVDSGKRLLLRGEETIPLTPKVFDTLLYLVENRGKVIQKNDLMSAIWPDTIVEENNLNKNISVLRHVLGENPGDHHYVVTVPGIGYKFVADVRKAPMAAEGENGRRIAHLEPRKSGWSGGRPVLFAARPQASRRSSCLRLHSLISPASDKSIRSP